MIAGNPKSCRALIIVSVAMAALIVLSAAFFASRKKTDPEKEPPLHPASYKVNVTSLPFLQSAKIA